VAAPPAPVAALPVRRNTALLAAALAANSAMLQLSAAVASLTLVLVLDVRGLLGLGPAIVLASGALAALPAGRAMDRIGRVPVVSRPQLVPIIAARIAWGIRAHRLMSLRRPTTLSPWRITRYG